MTLEQVLAFNLVLLAAIASPGPALLMAIQTSLSAGRTAGIAVGTCLGLMAAVWTLMALLGLGVLFQLLSPVYVSTKIMGAVYLLYIAYKMWRKCVHTGRRASETGEACFPARLSGELAQSEVCALRGGCSRNRISSRT